MWRTRSEEAAADAKKAEGASCTALRTPSLPNFTGKVACSHAGSDSSKWMLVIPQTIDRNALSYTSKAGERKHGDVLRLYNSFGMAKECFRRRMASWEERCTSLSPIFFSKAVFSSRMLLMELVSVLFGSTLNIFFRWTEVIIAVRNILSLHLSSF